MSARIRVQHELVGIEAVAVVGLVGAMDAITINRPRADARYIAVPDLVGKFGQFDPCDLVFPGIVEQAKLDAGRMR